MCMYYVQKDGKQEVDEQKTTIINMVLENNAITLREIRDRVLEDNVHFTNIDRVSLFTIVHVLNQHQLRVTQV